MNIATLESKSSKTTSELPGGQAIAAGRILKAATGTIEIPFGMTFAEPPFVVVSSNWANGVVGSIETIQNVERDRFQVNSANAAQNYYVSWIATGKK